MTPSIPIPFEVGSTVWWPGRGYKTREVTCPECCGTRSLKLTLGNGAVETLKCAHCGPGYDPPRGSVTEHYHEHTPEEITLGNVGLDSRDGPRYNIPDGGYVYATALFSTREACGARCVELNAAAAEDEERRRVVNLESKRRGLAFSVSYWRRKIADLKHEIEVAENQLGRSLERRKITP